MHLYNAFFTFEGAHRAYSLLLADASIRELTVRGSTRCFMQKMTNFCPKDGIQPVNDNLRIKALYKVVP